jgi:uncharacterized protein
MASTLNRVNWFEIPVKDLARAKKFYHSVFGLKLEDMEMDPIKMASFPMEENAPGASGALVQGKGTLLPITGRLYIFQSKTLKNLWQKL